MRFINNRLNSIRLLVTEILAVILLTSCGPHFVSSYFLLIKGDTTKKIKISYYDGSNRTVIVGLPYYKYVSIRDEGLLNAYLKICDTATGVQAMVFNPNEFGSCSIASMDVDITNLEHLIESTTDKPVIFHNCQSITIDSLFQLMKQKYPESYIERTPENKDSCSTAVPY